MPGFIGNSPAVMNAPWAGLSFIEYTPLYIYMYSDRSTYPNTQATTQENFHQVGNKKLVIKKIIMLILVIN